MAKSSARWLPVAPRSSRMSRWRRRRWRRLNCDLLAAHLVARGFHSLDDVLIACATAKVRGQHVEQFLVIDFRIFFQRIGGKHQEAWGAVAALQAVVLDE